MADSVNAEGHRNILFAAVISATRHRVRRRSSSELGKAASSAIAGRVAASLESALASKRRMASDREARLGSRSNRSVDLKAIVSGSRRAAMGVFPVAGGPRFFLC